MDKLQPKPMVTREPSIPGAVGDSSDTPIVGNPKSFPFRQFDADKFPRTCYQNRRQGSHLGHGGADGGSPFTDVDGGDVRSRQEAAWRQALSRRPDAGTSVPLQSGMRRLR